MRWIPLLMVVTLAGCVTPYKPGTYTPPTSALIPHSREVATAKAVQWCAANGAVVTSQSDAAVIARMDLAKAERRQWSAVSGYSHTGTLMVDCGGVDTGKPIYAEIANITMTFSEHGGTGAGTELTVAVVPEGATYGRGMDCVSTGAIERSVMEALGAAPRR